MKSKIFILFCLLIEISFISCNSNKTASNTEELDTVWNEKVQNSFYDLKLGTPTSVEQIVNSLEKQGFYFIKEYSTDESLHFRFLESQYFTFGGLTWEMLDIYREGDVLQAVYFRNSSLDKAESIQNYNYIKDAIENKYLPTSIQPKDTTIYEKTLYFGRNNVRAAVSCYRYETVTKKIMIGTELSYSQKNIKPANDEL
nr:hypothetical protein [uncultured Prevotella sp.]